MSIGNGTNDVVMIQEANVGCGLLGHGASQAGMSANYAPGQLRFLTKLPFVHGGWSYQRITDMHRNLFYKACFLQLYAGDQLTNIIRWQPSFRTCSGCWPCFSISSIASEPSHMIMGVVATDEPIPDSFDATYLYDYNFILLYNFI